LFVFCFFGRCSQPFHLPRHRVRRILGVFSSHFIFGTPETSLQLRISAEYSICCGLGLARIAQFAPCDESFGVMHFSAGNPCHWSMYVAFESRLNPSFPDFTADVASPCLEDSM
jgi:hypothetical protein